MAWVKLDDAMPHHPKVMGAGPLAFALDVAGICYSNKHALDGFIATYALPAVLPSLPDAAAQAARLVEVGRWYEVEGGWQIHDIGEYQPSAASTKEISRKRAEAGRRGGKRSGESRRSSAEANAKQVASTETNPGPSRPVPALPQDQPPTSDVPSDPEVSDEARELTRKFAQAVKGNGHEIPKRGTKAHRTWLVEMDRLLRLDGADPAEVAQVVAWCAADVGSGSYPGESVNVRAVPKFRKRYSELRLRAQRTQRPNGSAQQTTSEADYSDHSAIMGGA